MYRLTMATIVAVYLLILLGGFVSSSGSGMGCGPDWPLCNGQLIPLLEGDTLIEFGHRIAGAVIGLLSLLLAVNYWRRRKQRPELAGWVAAIMILLATQVLLGAITVYYHLPSTVTTIHLGVAMIFLGLLIVFAHSWQSGADTGKQPASSPGFARLVAVTCTAVFFMIVLGAAVKHTHASLACGWWNCHGSFLTWTGSQILQTVHRLGAVFVAVLVLWMLIRALREPVAENVRLRSGIALLLVAVQITLGVLTITSRLLTGYAVAHLGVATALFAVMVSLFATEVLLGSVARKRMGNKERLQAYAEKEGSGSFEPVH